MADTHPCQWSRNKWCWIPECWVWPRRRCGSCRRNHRENSQRWNQRHATSKPGWGCFLRESGKEQRWRGWRGGRKRRPRWAAWWWWWCICTGICTEKDGRLYTKNEEILGINCRSRVFVELKGRKEEVNLSYFYTELNEEDSFYIYSPAGAKKSSFVGHQTFQRDSPPPIPFSIDCNSVSVLLYWVDTHRGRTHRANCHSFEVKHGSPECPFCSPNITGDPNFRDYL